MMQRPMQKREGWSIFAASAYPFTDSASFSVGEVQINSPSRQAYICMLWLMFAFKQLKQIGGTYCHRIIPIKIVVSPKCYKGVLAISVKGLIKQGWVRLCMHGQSLVSYLIARECSHEPLEHNTHFRCRALQRRQLLVWQLHLLVHPLREGDLLLVAVHGNFGELVGYLV